MDLSPLMENQTINVSISKSSKESRDAAAKKLKEKLELTLKNLRNVRADGIKLLGKSTGVAEDELYRTRNEIQTASENAVNKCKELFEKKKDDIMNV